MQEQSLISILLFLIAQTIAIWKKLEKLEAKIDLIAQENKRQDEAIKEVKTEVGIIRKQQARRAKG